MKILLLLGISKFCVIHFRTLMDSLQYNVQLMHDVSVGVVMF